MCFFFFFFLMIRRPPRSTLFPYRRSSDLKLIIIIAKFFKSNDIVFYAHSYKDSKCLPNYFSSMVLSVIILQKNNSHPDRKSTRLNSSHSSISYAVFCLKKKKTHILANNTS